MNLKKFAMFTLTLTLITGVISTPVSAFASETETVSENVTIVENSSVDELVETEGENTEVQESTVNVLDSTKDTAMKGKSKNSSKKAALKKSKKKSSKKKADNTKAELRLMASIINCEAGIEPYQGKLAVGIVVMNRVKSSSFPGSIKSVIYQPGQFSPVRNGALRTRLAQYDAGKTKSAQWKSCIKAAKKVLSGQKTILYRGKTKSLRGYHFFSVQLRGARFKLGGHRFK